MIDRSKYPHLNPDVTIHECTAEHPMPIEIGDRAVELKQLWEHGDLQEIDEDFSGRFVTYKCGFCNYQFTADLGD